MTKREMGLGKSLFSVTGLLAVILILVLVNVLFARVNIRWDATEDNLYSLSDATRNIIGNLDSEVTVKVFFAKDVVNLPGYIKSYAGRVIDFLSEYENASGGGISIEVYNPKTDSEEEEWAQKYGIEGRNMPTGDRLYLGLVALAADLEETIPFMDPTREEHLEYDITRIITKVQTSKKNKIGILSTWPVFGGPPQGSFGQPQQRAAEPWVFITELKKTYEVIQYSPSATELHDDLDLLILFQPAGLSETLQFLIDQYVLRGKNLIVFADPVFTVEAAQRQQPQPLTINKLLAAWGVELETARVVADYNYPTRLRGPGGSVENNPVWLSLSGEAFNTEAIITSKLDSMLLPVAGAFKKAKGSDYSYEPLLQSSKNSALTDSYKARFGGGMIRRDFMPTIDAYDLAVKISGRFKSAFPKGKPAAAPQDNSPADKAEPQQKTADAPFLKEAAAESTIILVADADLLFDAFYVNRQNFLGFNIARVFNDNLNFLLNVSEMLSGSQELISIRSRGKFERPFTKVMELEQKAQARWLVREQELVRKVEETNNRLRELEKQKDSSQRFIMSSEQEAEVRKFKDEKIRINKELKIVRRKLRSEIESLGRTVKFANIFLMPIFVCLAGVIYAFYRRRKSMLN